MILRCLDGAGMLFITSTGYFEALWGTFIAIQRLKKNDVALFRLPPVIITQWNLSLKRDDCSDFRNWESSSEN